MTIVYPYKAWFHCTLLTACFPFIKSFTWHVHLQQIASFEYVFYQSKNGTDVLIKVEEFIRSHKYFCTMFLSKQLYASGCIFLKLDISCLPVQRNLASVSLKGSVHTNITLFEKPKHAIMP